MARQDFWMRVEQARRQLQTVAVVSVLKQPSCVVVCDRTEWHTSLFGVQSTLTTESQTWSQCRRLVSKRVLLSKARPMHEYCCSCPFMSVLVSYNEK